MTEESHVGAPAKIPALLASGAGLLLSILAALWLRSGQERAWAEEVRKLAEDRAEIIRGQLMRSMEVLHAVGAFFTARSEITRGEFRVFTERPLARQPELLELMGGQLCMESRPGRGSSFSLRMRESEGVEAARQMVETIELHQLILPEDLAARPGMAAELHSATVLKSCLR